jgi:hypothetical protein
MTKRDDGRSTTGDEQGRVVGGVGRAWKEGNEERVDVGSGGHAGSGSAGVQLRPGGAAGDPAAGHGFGQRAHGRERHAR